MADEIPFPSADDSETRCPVCGFTHPELDTLPSRPLTIDELDSLRNADAVVHVGPAGVSFSGDHSEITTISITTPGAMTAVSYFEAPGVWLVMLQKEMVDADEQDGLLFNEMTTQAVEAGYPCVAKWLDDGEPGGNAPGGSGE